MTVANAAAAAGRFSIGGALAVSRMGFGALRVTGEGFWGDPPSPDAARALLRRVVDLGVTLIDTADSYGPVTSETLIREALHPYPAELVIATKGGLLRPGPDRWIPCGRPEYLIQQAKLSARRLGVEQIALWQLHRVDPLVPADEQFAAIRSLIDEGVIRYAGLSEVRVEEVEAASRHFPVASVQNAYNVAQRGSEAVLRHCEANGIAFLAYYPMGRGGLANGDAAGVLAKAAARYGATPGQIALAWLLDHSPAMVVIPGTSSVQHLEANVAAAAMRLDAADRERLDALDPVSA